MVQKCDSCGHESGSCNSYLTPEMQEITICPSCLVFGCDAISKAARVAHEQGRLIVDNDKKVSKKKGGRK